MSYIVGNWFTMNLFIFLLTLSFVSFINCQSECTNLKSCGTCISNKDERCVWCSENKNITTFRCQPESHMHTSKNWCTKEAIKKPATYDPTQKPKLDEPFSSKVQFRPQQIKVKASPGVDVKIDTFFRPAKDFPVDVYFLMDYSYTMMAHRKSLEDRAMDIYAGLVNMTSNVTLGVGSFVEKPGLPYTDINVAKNSTYAFKNHLSLTDNMTDFKRVVHGSEFGSNYDDAEAGLDALMQVMTCIKDLKWREDTRRIIVLATDNTYHSAGDGKMLGAIKPNDAKCHLKDNEYKREDSLMYDYPSVSLVNKVARDGRFLIIFAGLQRVKPIYEALSKQISGSRYAVLQENSNILEIIKAAYEKSVRQISIDHKFNPSMFKVTIDQECNTIPRRNCEITPTNRILKIPVTIRSINCSTTGRPEIITLFPTGLHEKLEVSFEVVCQCDCEKTGSNVTRPNCSNNGIIQCGACKCDNDWGGDFCEVSCSDDNDKRLEEKCFPANSTRKCNNHGTCECGICTCTDRYTGDVCEYSPYSCETGENGKICSDHGACTRGKCECESDFSGTACDCPREEISVKRCTAPFSTEVCSGKGKCSCGKCECNEVGYSDKPYIDVFCNSDNDCQKLEGYAKCNFNSKKDICDKEFSAISKTNVNVIVANKSELISKDEWKKGISCSTPLDDGTILLFKYVTDTEISLDNKMWIMIQKEVEVPPKADLLVPIASAIAGIILIGLLTVVFWKVLIELYDKREYTKFCEEAKTQGFDISMNPLYEPPTQNFVNPGFNQEIH